jgi:hypothetical protein
MRAPAAAILVLAAVAGAGPARAEPDDYDQLGSLERIEVDAVLAQIQGAVERAPAGKTIRNVLVVTRPVFAEDEGFLTWFNRFHVTTHEDVIRRELLFASGEAWDHDRVDESLRNLRDPLFHNVLVIVPLTTDAPGQIDVLVVVRDTWSLRLSTAYQILGLQLVSLYVSLSESNLLGWRKRVGLVFNMDLGSIELGPSYYDPNIAGTHLQLTALARLIFARDGGALEGTRSDILFALPFWRLSSIWSAQLHLIHYVGFYRSFVGTGPRTYDDPDTPAVEAVPWFYKRRELTIQPEVVRSFGTDVIQRVGLGYELILTRPALTDDFPDDPTLRAAFTRDVLPRSELESAVYARWQLFTPVWAPFRDIDTFDYREDFQLGPTATARLAVARTELGSDRSFLVPSATAGWVLAAGGGLYKASGSFSARYQDGSFIDQSWSLAAEAISPIMAGGFRVLAAFNLDWLTNEQNNQFYTLGGDNGLRGYPVGELSGLARGLGHVELRTLPLGWLFFRIGAAGFWDFGSCAPSVGELSMVHDLGLGLRLLIPQSDQIVIRFDWAVALEGQSSGFPGRFSLGVGQAF